MSFICSFHYNLQHQMAWHIWLADWMSFYLSLNVDNGFTLDFAKRWQKTWTKSWYYYDYIIYYILCLAIFYSLWCELCTALRHKRFCSTYKQFFINLADSFVALWLLRNFFWKLLYKALSHVYSFFFLWFFYFCNLELWEPTDSSSPTKP